MCCSMLQCVELCCSERRETRTRGRAVCCSVLQFEGGNEKEWTSCVVSQCVAVRCTVREETRKSERAVLKSGAVWCFVLNERIGCVGLIWTTSWAKFDGNNAQL